MSPDRAHNPSVDSSVYEKRSEALTAFNVYGFEAFQNVRLIPRGYRPLIVRRVSISEFDTLSELMHDADMRSGIACSELCRSQEFSDKRHCGAFEATIRVFRTPSSDKIFEHLTCQLHTDGLFDDEGAAMLVADEQANAQESSIAMRFVGAMNNNDGTARVCWV